MVIGNTMLGDEEALGNHLYWTKNILMRLTSCLYPKP